MLTTSDVDSDTEIARQRRGAAGFFWALLNIATSMSVAGNAAHAGSYPGVVAASE
jgi:hypothetical protein